MLEIEIKLPISSGSSENQLAEQIMKLGFKKEYEILEKDIYLDNIDGQIRQSGGALRMRSVRDLKRGTEKAFVTFKGPKLDTISMSRRELETGVEDADTMLAVLKMLGYTPVKPCVVKKRCGYHNGRMNVCLDNVDGLGYFLELEIVTDEPKQEQSRENIRQAALKEIELVLQQLGYGWNDTVTNSYLSMLQHQTD